MNGGWYLALGEGREEDVEGGGRGGGKEKEEEGKEEEERIIRPEGGGGWAPRGSLRSSAQPEPARWPKKARSPSPFLPWKDPPPNSAFIGGIRISKPSPIRGTEGPPPVVPPAGGTIPISFGGTPTSIERTPVPPSPDGPTSIVEPPFPTPSRSEEPLSRARYGGNRIPSPSPTGEIAAPLAGAASASPARAADQDSGRGTAAGSSAYPRAAGRRGHGRAERGWQVEAAATAAAAAAASVKPKPWPCPERGARGTPAPGRHRGCSGGGGDRVADVTRARQPGKGGRGMRRTGGGSRAAAPSGCGWGGAGGR